MGEIHIALVKLIIKDIEDVARTPSLGLGTNQNTAAGPEGGHPHIVEGVIPAPYMNTMVLLVIFWCASFSVLWNHLLTFTFHIRHMHGVLISGTGKDT